MARENDETTDAVPDAGYIRVDRQWLAETRARAEAASIPDEPIDEKGGHSGYLGYDVDGIPSGIRYAFERIEDYRFLLHARADLMRALDLIAAQEAEIARLQGHVETILQAAGAEANRTMFTLTPEHGLGQIINECGLALRRHPYTGAALVARGEGSDGTSE